MKVRVTVRDLEHGDVLIDQNVDTNDELAVHELAAKIAGLGVDPTGEDCN